MCYSILFTSFVYYTAAMKLDLVSEKGLHLVLEEDGTDVDDVDILEMLSKVNATVLLLRVTEVWISPEGNNSMQIIKIIFPFFLINFPIHKMLNYD